VGHSTHWRGEKYKQILVGSLKRNDHLEDLGEDGGGVKIKFILRK
jgi:hypothetical protein